MRKFLLSSAAVLVGMALVGEGVARFGLGLGSPPLSVAHPSIEYMFAPNQDVWRFGNRHIYNEYGMRSPQITEIRTARRVLVLGDSVVNGGNQTDHDALATSLVSNDDVFFGNVSAGSWGPANIAAWLEEFGALEAESAVVVLNSADAHDVPGFGNLNPNTHPTEAPVLALQEVFLRYLPRYLPDWSTVSVSSEGNSAPNQGEDYEGGIAGISRLLSALATLNLRTCLIQHQSLRELKSNPEPGWRIIQDAFEAQDHVVVQFADWTLPKLDSTPSPFRDNIHLSDKGQK